MPPTSQFFQVPASGEFERLEPVREHRQCLLFLNKIAARWPAKVTHSDFSFIKAVVNKS